MTRERLIAIMKEHVFPNPSVNVVCDVEGFEEAADAIMREPGYRCTQCGWPVDTDAKPEFGK